MLYFLFAAAIAVFDQLFKHWIVQNIDIGSQLPLIPGVIHLTYVRNTGAAFSMLENMRWPLVAVSSICAILIIIFIIKTRMGFWGRISLAAILGGAIGNGIDRVINGYVVDMFEVDFVRYAIFNVADSFIIIGGTIFCLTYLIYSAKLEKEKKKKAHKDRQTSGFISELGDESDLSETKILEAYDLERSMREDTGEDNN